MTPPVDNIRRDCAARLVGFEKVVMPVKYQRIFLEYSPMV